MLPVETIPSGCHVCLDVQALELKIGRVFHCSIIVCKKYALRDTDTALRLYEYITSHQNRFASVRIT